MELAPLYLVALGLWMLCILRSLHYLRLGNMAKRQSLQPVSSTNPPVSIVITAHNQLKLLQKLVPLLLGQDYDNTFEVIVADMNSDDETLSWLEDLEERYPVQLRHTSTPSTSRDISMHRLALMLGLRAADYDWVVLLQPTCTPSGEGWLKALCSACDNHHDAIQAFAHYDNPRGWNALKWQFIRLWDQMAWMPWSQRFTPYRADGSCLLYRKPFFLQHQGFSTHANLVAGAEELMVNHNVARGRFTNNLNPTASVSQQLPDSERAWHQDQLFFMDTTHHMRHATLYHLWRLCLMLLQPLFNVVFLPFMVWHWPNPFVFSAMAVMWLAQAVIRDVCFNFTARRLGTTTYHITLPFLVNLLPLWNLTTWLKWRFTNKKTFRKKFV